MPLVRALVFKTRGRLEESRRWVRFPYAPARGVFRFLLFVMLFDLYPAITDSKQVFLFRLMHGNGTSSDEESTHVRGKSSRTQLGVFSIGNQSPA